MLNPLWWRSILVVAVGLALAGCFEASSNGQTTTPAATMGAPTAGPNAAAIAGPVAPAVTAAGPMTLTAARESCWMDVENNKKAPNNLDQRAKLVDQCVTAKMNGQPAR
jgi:hypothetical protein